MSHPKQKPRLSASRLQTFMGCKRRYWWCYHENLVPRETASYLQVGVVVHELREAWLKGQLSEHNLETLVDAVLTRYPNQDREQAVEVALEAARLFNRYVQNYDETSDIKLVSPELTLEADFGDYILYSRFDGLAVDSTGTLLRNELKTASRMDSSYLQGLHKGLQTGISYLLVDSLGLNIRGTLFEILVKTKTPQYARSLVLKDPWLVEYTKQCIDGVWRDIKKCGNKKENYYPSMNCSFGRAVCPYEPLCRNDTPNRRAELYTHREEVINPSSTNSVVEAINELTNNQTPNERSNDND